MRGRTSRALLFPLLLVPAGALVLLRAIYAHPEALPVWLAGAGRQIVEAIGPEDVEAALNAEFAFVLAVSLAASALIYILVRSTLGLARR